MNKWQPLVPDPLSLEQVFSSSEVIQQFQQRIQASEQRFEVARQCIPSTLWPHIKPGPIDNTSWTVLAANPAVAAKLHHCVPSIEEALMREAYLPLIIRIKVWLNLHAQ